MSKYCTLLSDDVPSRAKVQTEGRSEEIETPLKGHKPAVLTWLHHSGGEQREEGETLQDIMDDGAEISDFSVVYGHKHLSSKMHIQSAISTKSTLLRNTEYLYVAVYV